MPRFLERPSAEGKGAPSAWPLVAAAAFVLVVHLATLWTMPRHVFWVPDSGAKWMQLSSLRWDGLRPAWEVPFPVTALDPAGEFLPDRTIFPRPRTAADGTLELPFESPPAFPVLSWIANRWLGFDGIYLLPLLGGWGTAVLCGWLTRRWFGAAFAAAAALTVGLATPLWFYGVLFWEHTPATFLALGSAFVALGVTRQAPTPLGRGLLGCAAAAALVALRPEMLAFAAALFAAVVISHACARRFPETNPVTPAGAQPPAWLAWVAAAGLGAIAAAAVGFALSERHYRFLTGLPSYVGERLPAVLADPRVLTDILITSRTDEGPAASDAVALLVGLGALVATLSAFVRRRRVAAALFAAGAPTVGAFAVWLLATAQPYRSLHGVVPVAPFVLFAPFGLVLAWRRRCGPLFRVGVLAAAYLPLGCLAIAVAYLRDGRLDVGLEWGQRYLLTLFPLLAILALAALREALRSHGPLGRRRAVLATFLVLLQLAVLLQLRGLATARDSALQLAALDDALRREDVVVTDLYWLPSALAPFAVERNLFFVADADAFNRFAARARHAGVAGFTFVGFGPPPHAGTGAAAAQVLATESRAGMTLTRLAVPPRP